MSKTPIKYLHLYPGQGGVQIFPQTVKLNNDTEHVVNAAGTSSCITTVGVFMPMDDKTNKYFVAHIVAIVGAPHDMRAWCPAVLHPTENLVSDALKDAVITALKEDPMIKQHYQKVAKAAREKHGIIVCPAVTLGKDGPDTKYTTGHDIIRAIREFFEVPALTISGGHGFCREGGEDGEVHLFGWKSGDNLTSMDFRPMLDGRARPGEKQPETYGWRPCNEDERGENSGRGIKQFAEVPRGPWSFVYRDGKWQRNDAALFEDQEA
ncbi:hypothetical protein CLAFUW4_04324 [Fulvia fulva]|uniref:Uncharacterized protein n=1 Tax=Passalora fulva TaxID=5499 RepID=A0A9Q8LG99_PASFU|nr:uncharacterized protein CLAFUR5_04288 [Fulvia fulva]KAK4626235.1 hypothetical protein CLAFUR4_04310 [Fulvia fulva]KAK4627384.1 hypothetical protein CLAFUR0_04312 [Fulvia fulva]UJO16848.1 hypothetical protein CLAFUR5_04288 [Fulvia fulva]WPV13855.1 hypothetical protein CLAFUW4_04324 [Fulvia fulva]WPV28906.1 hypothetical protein CLAFUW7_04313 [Fulvia fulva]